MGAAEVLDSVSDCWFGGGGLTPRGAGAVVETDLAILSPAAPPFRHALPRQAHFCGDVVLAAGDEAAAPFESQWGVSVEHAGQGSFRSKTVSCATSILRPAPCPAPQPSEVTNVMTRNS